MLSFLPRSQIAVLATGFLFPYVIVLNLLLNFNSLYFILLIFIFIVIYYIKKRKILIRNITLLIIGFLLGTISQQLNKYNEENNRINLLKKYKQINSYKLDPIQITPIKHLFGDFYLAKVYYNSTEIILPFRAYGAKRWEAYCKSEKIKIDNVSSKNQYYRTLKSLGGHYLTFNKKDCKLIKEHIFPSQLAKNKLTLTLEKAGIKGIYQGIAMGLLFGESKFLDRELYEDAQESGTLHLFAASGLHMGILLGFLYFFTKQILHLDYYSSILIPLLAGFAYLYILNFPVSLTRAFIFACMIALSKCLFRDIRPTDLLLITATGIALFQPENLFSIGFNLSFSAVAGIFYLKPKLDQFLFQMKKSFLTDNLTVSLSATLGTFFVSWYYFPGFSFGGILANLILVPLTGFLLPILYANIIIDLSNLKWIAQFFWVWTDFLLRILILATEFLSNTIGFYRDWGNGRFPTIYLFLTIISLILFLPYYKKIKWIYTSLFFLIFPLFFIFGFIANQPQAPKFKNNFDLLSISQDSYFFLIKNDLYLGGYCKKDLYNLKKKISKGFCRNINSLYIEHDSCIPIARNCYMQNKNLFLKFANKRLKDWSPAFGKNQIAIIKKNSLYNIGGKPVLIYKAGWDANWLPKYLAKKNRKGILVLQKSLIKNVHKSNQFPQLETMNSNGSINEKYNENLKDSKPTFKQIENQEVSQDKEKWKKSLGIPSDWIILDQSELADFSLL
jgi:ComEC/Rec2-related protein